MYESTTELSGDMPVYIKVGDGDMWLEYHAAKKSWQVKSTTSKGTSRCLSACVVPDKCLPQECPVGQWQVYDGENWKCEPAVSINVANCK